MQDTIWTSRLNGKKGIANEFIHQRIPRGIAAYLAAQEITIDGIEQYLNSPPADPFLMIDMEKTVSKIWQSVLENESILLFADGDFDGITACALLSSFFSKIKADISIYIANKKVNQNSFSTENLKEAFTLYAKQNCKLLILLGCGSQNSSAFELASKKYSADVIVIDKGKKIDEGESLPNAFSVLNPNYRREEFPIFGNMATVGLAFELTRALLAFASRHGGHCDIRQSDIAEFFVLGTLEKHCQLIGENRILMKRSLESIQKKLHIGMETLFKNVMKIPYSTEEITKSVLPRLKAAERKGNIKHIYNLLVTTHKNIVDECLALVEEDYKYCCDEKNKLRKEIEFSFGQNSNFENDCTIFEYRNDWNSLAFGMILFSIVHKYHRPAVILTNESDEIACGMMVSIQEISLESIIESIAPLLIDFSYFNGGAWIRLTQSNIQKVREAFNLFVHDSIDKGMLIPEIYYDAEIKIRDLSDNYFAFYSKLLPFGDGNPNPRYLFRNLYVQNVTMPMKKHSKGILVDEMECSFAFIAFNQKIIKGEVIDVIAEPLLENFKGKKRKILKIINYKPSSISNHDNEK